ncbi:hypothetical protein GGX14DRAFT_632681 [Mycena pura]|uniref:TEA domain-containing protein n=1 Tax=Mycena pura TaxID=153505 RepID=A0AAD6YAQ1_9AGAR|nr:hypothetical protein GGX14DRAFT_632681 [Mycena pura]
MYYRECDQEAASTGSLTPPTASADRLHTPISGGAWQSLQSQTTKEVLQTVLKVRKSWKTLRGGETVWPLELEAALLEGKLAARVPSYVPDDSRETRLLGRFPRRNRFISDHIYERTGKRRSPKQVGSRLQQLRESCGGKKLLHLLSPFRQPYPDSCASSDSSCTSPVSPVMDAQALPRASDSRRTVVYIDILREGTAADNSSPTFPQWADAPDVVRISDRPRSLRVINPTVSLLAQSPVTAQSQFTVYAEDRVMHVETVPLTPVEDPIPVAGCLYRTALVPAYWRTISESPDPTRFTINQEVVKDDASSLIFSATYKFAYPDSRHSSAGFPHSLDTLGTRTDMNALISAASIDAAGDAHADRYPLYIAPQWSPVHASRENSPMQGYRSPSSDSSACFPSDLSNYVSLGKKLLPFGPSKRTYLPGIIVTQRSIPAIY